MPRCAIARSVRVSCSVRGEWDDEEVASMVFSLLGRGGGERGRIDEGSMVRRRTSSIGSVGEEVG